MREAGKAAVIPPRRSRKVQRDHDRDRYAARHPGEHFLCTLKPFRGTATPYDTTKRNFLASVYLAATFVALN